MTLINTQQKNYFINQYKEMQMQSFIKTKTPTMPGFMF